jgi:hypothetical protein
MAKRKKIGDVYRFDFDKKFHCYCQILEASDVVFFNFYSDSENDNIDEVIEKDELFRIWLDRDCLKSDKWQFICHKELSAERKIVFDKYNNPSGGTDFFILRNEKNAEFIKVAREQCFGLELAAAWTESGIINRLNYSFLGIPLPMHIKKDIPFYK